MSASVFIYCDDPSHPRRVAVTNFDRIDQGMFAGHWHERPASRAGTSAGTGMTMVRDDVGQPGWALDPTITNAETRPKHDLGCRKCASRNRGRRRPFPVNPGTLHQALNHLADIGESEVSLSDLAAILRMQAKIEGSSRPDPGQG